MSSRARRALGALTAVSVASALLFLPGVAGATSEPYLTLTFHVTASAKSLAITINTSQAGTATITGPGLKKTVKALPVGTHKVTVSLTKTGESERREAKKITVTVSLKEGTKTASATEKIKL
jgi:hypothetical protein